jgi:hypothetical protein
MALFHEQRNRALPAIQIVELAHTKADTHLATRFYKSDLHDITAHDELFTSYKPPLNPLDHFHTNNHNVHGGHDASILTSRYNSCNSHA